MKRFHTILSIAMAVMAFSAYGAGAQTIIGDLNNFDTLNDTGQICYGFEIEIDGIHSTDISYTFDWNHYGPPKIREDSTDPTNPKVFVRYESTKDTSGKWGANGSFTNVALPTTAPPSGHTCTDTSVNEGCEHFGVGYLATPTTVKYHWLIDDNAGGLVYFGTPVGVATPKWTYTPPVPGGAAAQVVAAIPAPALPVAGREFGEPSWVKVIKTTSHNASPMALGDLISDDTDGDGKANWQNGEPDEVETEWKLLQARAGADGANDELQGVADDMGDGSEVVTRRYEFYKYGAALDTLDGETGEAMCSEVQLTTDPNDPLYLHGVGTNVAVTDADGKTYYVNCEEQVVVGNYIGAQMAGFAAEVPLGLIDHLQDGALGTPYTPRTVVVGGTAPYTIAFPLGSLPQGLSLPATGVLSGTPSESGDFSFTVQATDALDASVSGAFTLRITGAAIPQVNLTVQKSGTGTGTVLGSGIDCGGTCSVMLDQGTAVSLVASPTGGSVFTGWSGDCTGTGSCSLAMNAAHSVTATFVPPTQQYALSVTVTGSGSVTSSPKGINCGKQCSKPFAVGTSVTLTAKAKGQKHNFLGWTGACATSAISLTCTVPTMLHDETVGANFD
jgi:hypothetical protein